MVDDHADFGVEEMIEIRTGNAKLAHYNDYCVILESGSFTDFSKKAKEASASEEHSKGRIALAIIISGLPMRLLTDIYLKINKPVVPTKAFSSKIEAKKWLQNQRDYHYMSLPDKNRKKVS